MNDEPSKCIAIFAILPYLCSIIPRLHAKASRKFSLFAEHLLYIILIMGVPIDVVLYNYVNWIKKSYSLEV